MAVVEAVVGGYWYFAGSWLLPRDINHLAYILITLLVLYSTCKLIQFSSPTVYTVVYTVSYINIGLQIEEYCIGIEHR